MASNETTQEQQGRPMDRFEADLADEGRAVIKPLVLLDLIRLHFSACRHRSRSAAPCIGRWQRLPKSPPSAITRTATVSQRKPNAAISPPIQFHKSQMVQAASSFRALDVPANLVKLRHGSHSMLSRASGKRVRFVSLSSDTEPAAKIVSMRATRSPDGGAELPEWCRSVPCANDLSKRCNQRRCPAGACLVTFPDDSRW